MGVDVRQYAMANQDVKRAACVGCGMCAHVCPRGVLKLEDKLGSEAKPRFECTRPTCSHRETTFGSLGCSRSLWRAVRVFIPKRPSSPPKRDAQEGLKRIREALAKWRVAGRLLSGVRQPSAHTRTLAVDHR
jgi:ferredoxin